MWGDAKVSILSACGAAKQGVPGRPRPWAHSFWHWSPSFILSSVAKSDPCVLGS